MRKQYFCADCPVKACRSGGEYPVGWPTSGESFLIQRVVKDHALRLQLLEAFRPTEVRA